jgi:predicted GNAT superfamily acetyltransferase
MATALLSHELRLRHVERGDHVRVRAVIDEWWGGRPMSSRLSHVFFVHFRPTSFLFECDDELLAFLLGFTSQTTPNEAYVHFVGVRPDFRCLGLARRLYERFFTVASLKGCNTVRSHTSPTNELSIAFHAAMRFEIDPGDDVIAGVPVWRDYSGPSEHRVRFVKHLRFHLPELRAVDGDRLMVPEAVMSGGRRSSGDEFAGPIRFCTPHSETRGDQERP